MSVKNILRRIIPLLLSAVLVLGLTGCGYGPDENVIAEISEMGLGAGEITLTRRLINAYGQKLAVYSDDIYDYTAAAKTGYIGLVEMNEDSRERMEEELSANPGRLISEEEAYEIMYSVVERYFPIYKRENLQVNLEPVQSAAQHFNFTVEEIEDDARLNIASVSLAFDGQLSRMFGSENDDSVAFMEYRVKKEALPIIALDYMNSLEEDGKQYETGDLTEYDYIRGLYRGELAWQLSFMADGEEHTIFIDAQSGEVVDTAEPEQTEG